MSVKYIFKLSFFQGQGEAIENDSYYLLIICYIITVFELNPKMFYCLLCAQVRKAVPTTELDAAV